MYIHTSYMSTVAKQKMQEHHREAEAYRLMEAAREERSGKGFPSLSGFVQKVIQPVFEPKPISEPAEAGC